MRLGGPLTIAGLLSFNGGFVDVTTFIGLHGLFAAHITGNFATLCASLVITHQGVISKMLAVPEFIAAVALAHLGTVALKSAALPTRRTLLVAEAALLGVYLALGLIYGPFARADSVAALVTALFAIAAMGVQDAAQLVHLRSMAPTTFMTQAAAQIGINLVNTLVPGPVNKPLSRRRLGHFGLNFACFGVGAAAAAVTFWSFGFAAVAITVPIALAAAAMPV